jgi:hypothetical protein
MQICGMKFDSFDTQRHILVEHMQKGDIPSDEESKKVRIKYFGFTRAMLAMISIIYITCLGSLNHHDFYALDCIMKTSRCNRRYWKNSNYE